MPADDPKNLEAKINLLLALAVDERIWTVDRPQDASDILNFLKIDISIPEETLRAARLLNKADDKEYILTRGWVGRRLDDVQSQLAKLREDVLKIEESAGQSLRIVTENQYRTSELRDGQTAIKTDTSQLLTSHRAVREDIDKISSIYSTLRTDSADIAADLKGLRDDVKKTSKDIEEISAAIAKLQDKK